jgi:hypothetical protein
MCYFNSLMQAMLSCTAFTSIENVSNPIEAMFLQLADGLIDNFHAFNVLASHPGIKMNMLDTNCAHSLYMYIIDNCPALARRSVNRYTVTINCPKCSFVSNEQKINEYSFLIHDEFVNVNEHIRKYIDQLDYQLDCSCNQPSLAHASTSLVDEPTSLAHTTSSTDAVKIHRLGYVSEVIVLHVFNEMHATFHNIPQELLFMGSNGQSMEYRLVAVIYHSSNHYWTICIRNGLFYMFNDHYVQQLPINRFPTNGYLYFYHYA